MKTLLVHCSDDDELSYLCEKSASRSIDVVGLSEISSASPLRRRLMALKGRGTVLGGHTVDLNEYDRVILASDEFCGGIFPAMNSFLKANDFRYKDISCIVFGSGKGADRALDVMKIGVSLAGGTVNRALAVSRRDIKRYDEDVLYFVRHKMAV